MPRITPVPRSKYPIGARILDRFTRKLGGQPLATIAVHAHSPGLVWNQAWMDRYFVSKRAVPARTLELVSVRTAMEIGCGFCIDFGSHMAKHHHGVSIAELHALSDHASSDHFAADEQAALDLAVGMAATPPTVDDALLARLSEHYSEEQIVELCAMAAWENHRARLNLALGLDAQGFSEPGACAVASPAAAAAHASGRSGAAPAASHYPKTQELA